MARLNCYPEKNTKNILDKLVESKTYKSLGSAVDDMVLYFCIAKKIDIEKLLVTDFSVQLPHVNSTVE